MKKNMSKMWELFSSLETVCNEYQERVGGHDVLYWWTERSLVGATLIAAHNIGWATIQEYHGNKKGQARRWIDLYASVKKTEYLIEAKQIFISANSFLKTGRGLTKDALKQIEDAVSQTKAIKGRPGWGQKRIIILYLVPFFSSSDDVDGWPERMRKAVDSKVKSKLPKDWLLDEIFHYERPYDRIKEIRSEAGQKNYFPGFSFCVLTNNIKS